MATPQHTVIYELPSKVKEQFNSWNRIFSGSEPSKFPEKFMRIISLQLSKLLPETLVKDLEQMRKTGSPNVIILRNMPIGEGIPSGSAQETVAGRLKKKDKTSELSILGLASLMNQRLNSSPYEHEGSMIHNVHPQPGHEAKISSKGKQSLYLHTETPYELQPPNFLILLCLEGDFNTRTTFCMIEKFLAKLPAKAITEAQKPDYEFSSGDSYTQKVTLKTPLIAQDKHDNRCRFRIFQDVSRIKPCTKNAEKTLLHFRNAFEQIMPDIEGVVLMPGDVLLFNNGFGLQERIRGVMHGRDLVHNPFRWLQRGFLFDMDPSFQLKVEQGHAEMLTRLFYNPALNVRLNNIILYAVYLTCLKMLVQHVAVPENDDSFIPAVLRL